MTIKSIRIDNLFEIFDYDISFNNNDNNENVLIITGPNGFGKTMILNIIFNLFNRKILFFRKLVFKTITIFLDDGISIIISKKSENNSSIVKFTFVQNEREIETFDYSNKQLKSHIQRTIQKYMPISRIGSGGDGDKWLDHRTDKILTSEDLIDLYGVELEGKFFNVKEKQTNDILDSIQVHFIKEQRLFRAVEPTRNIDKRWQKERTILIETIQEYAGDLKQLIAHNSQKYFKMSQELDSSYPNRLISESDKISEEEYNIRFNELKEKQDKLKINDLYESKQEDLEYSEPDSKALLVYLNDLKDKLGVFDNILEKLELFRDILNNRRFTHKSIEIDREKGFYFRTIKGKELELTQLSSGEQHEVILLFELIFNAKQNTLVLIDEPEISLHISWQKEFLNDLLRITNIQNIQVIIATHSPSIVNGMWGLCHNLEEVDVK